MSERFYLLRFLNKVGYNESKVELAILWSTQSHKRITMDDILFSMLCHLINVISTIYLTKIQVLNAKKEWGSGSKRRYHH